GGPGGFGGFGGGAMGLLLRQDVRDELELLDSQVEELTKIRDDLMGQFRGLMAPDENLSMQDRIQRGREMMEKVQEEMDQKLGQVLLSHQKKRLDQLSNQMALRGGFFRGLTSEQMVEELNITQQQRERLRTKAEQLEAELRQKIAELRTQAQSELLKELTPAQQAQVRERFGEPFDFQRFEMPQPGRGGGAGWGAGGQGPGAREPRQGDSGSEETEPEGRTRRTRRPQ
ncbi:MAG: hypothetical protein EA424_15680, partial [Planctomycetaceae bacterium]